MKISHSALQAMIGAMCTPEVLRLLHELSAAADLIYEREARRTMYEFGIGTFASARHFKGYQAVRVDVEEWFPKIIQLGVKRVVSGNGPHLMEEYAYRGRLAGAESTEVSIGIQGEQVKREYTDFPAGAGPQVVMDAHSLPSRVWLMASMLDALIADVGGRGTLKELFDLLQLIQLQIREPERFPPHLPRRHNGRVWIPKVYVRRGCWQQLMDLDRHMHNVYGTIADYDLDLMRPFDSLGQVHEWLQDDLRAWRDAPIQELVRTNGNGGS